MGLERKKIIKKIKRKKRKIYDLAVKRPRIQTHATHKWHSTLLKQQNKSNEVPSKKTKRRAVSKAGETKRRAVSKAGETKRRTLSKAGETKRRTVSKAGETKRRTAGKKGTTKKNRRKKQDNVVWAKSEWKKNNPSNQDNVVWKKKYSLTIKKKKTNDIIFEYDDIIELIITWVNDALSIVGSEDKWSDGMKEHRSESLNSANDILKYYIKKLGKDVVAENIQKNAKEVYKTMERLTYESDQDVIDLSLMRLASIIVGGSLTESDYIIVNTIQEGIEPPW